MTSEEIIEEQQSEIADLLEELRLAEEEITRTQDNVKKAFLAAYPESEKYVLLSLQAWLQCATENGWEY